MYYKTKHEAQLMKFYHGVKCGSPHPYIDNFSPSLLCLIEKGERATPDKFIEKIERILMLTSEERMELINAKAALRIQKVDTDTIPTKQIKRETERLLNELYVRVEKGSEGNDLVDSIISKIKQMNERSILKAA